MVDRPTWTGSPIAHTAAAHLLLAIAEEVTPASPLALAEQGAGTGVMAYAEPDTTDGARRLSLDPTDLPDVAGRLGRVLAALEEVPVVRFALGARGRRFVRTAPSPAEAVVGRAEIALALATRVGVPPGLLQRLRRELHARIGQDTGLSTTCSPPILSHGKLTPAALHWTRTAGTWSFAGVAEWDLAAAAPPERDRAPLLDLPVSTLSHILAGHEAGSRWLATSDGLRIWHLLHAIERLGHIGQAVLRGDKEALQLVEHAVLLAERALDPDFARSVVEAALDSTGDRSRIETGLRPDPLRANLRHTLMGGASLLQADAPLLRAWCSALAVDLLALETPIEERPALGSIGQVANAVRTQLHPLAWPQASPAARDDDPWNSWWTRAESDAAAVLLWTVRDAVETLEIAPDALPATLRQVIESAIGVMNDAALPEAASLRLGHAVLAAAVDPERYQAAATLADARFLAGSSDVAHLSTVLDAVQGRPTEFLSTAPLLARALRRGPLPIAPAALTEVRW